MHIMVHVRRSEGHLWEFRSLLPCGTWGSNSGHQAGQPAPLPSKPSRHTSPSFSRLSSPLHHESLERNNCVMTSDGGDQVNVSTDKYI